MIISEKWKYIFVGLPFSASSAISKELVEFYDGQPISWKHSNITELQRQGMINIDDYFVFAVYRNPVDIAFTHYNKFLTNAHGVYTNPKYFKENGGWVSKRVRHVFNEVRENNLDFENYLKLSYKFPYDSVYSLNKSHLNFVIDFENLNSSFYDALKQLGIEPERDMPMFNKTEKLVQMDLSKKTFRKVFAPFVNNSHTPTSEKGTILSRSFYHLVQPIRFLKWRRIDRKMENRTVDDYSFLSKKT